MVLGRVVRPGLYFFPLIVMVDSLRVPVAHLVGSVGVDSFWAEFCSAWGFQLGADRVVPEGEFSLRIGLLPEDCSARLSSDRSSVLFSSPSAETLRVAHDIMFGPRGVLDHLHADLA